MNDIDLLTLIILTVAVLIDFLASAAGGALLNVDPTRFILHRGERSAPQLDQALRLIHALPRFKTSLEFIQTILRFLIAAVALWRFVRWDTLQNNPQQVLEILFFVTLVIFLVEWTGQLLVLRQPETWARRLLPLARGAMTIAAPFVTFPYRFIAGGQPESEASVTESELINLVDASQQEGLLERDEHKMIVSIFRLGDTLAREIMVPRIDILALEVDTPIAQAVDILLQTGHSRAPVFKDTVDNIVGLLYAKDLLRVWRDGSQPASLRELLRPAYFVPEAKKVDELLAELQARRIHMAIVVDEYGGVAGLVTLEDIVEEIVGEIRDEYDQGEEQVYQMLNENEYLFQGRIDLDDFNEIMGTALPKNEAESLSGLIYSRIGRVPAPGDQVRIGNLSLTVEQVSGQRIRKVRAAFVSPDSDKSEEIANQEQVGAPEGAKHA